MFLRGGGRAAPVERRQPPNSQRQNKRDSDGRLCVRAKRERVAAPGKRFAGEAGKRRGALSDAWPLLIDSTADVLLNDLSMHRIDIGKLDPNAIWFFLPSNLGAKFNGL